MADENERLKINQIPSEDDPRWEKVAAPLLDFLSDEPKTWPEMKSFCRTARISSTVCLNALAWLENRHLIKSYYAKDHENLVLWVAQSARTYARTLSPKVVEEALRSLRIDPYKPRRGRSKSDDDSMNREPSNTVEGAQDPLSTANL